MKCLRLIAIFTFMAFSFCLNGLAYGGGYSWDGGYKGDTPDAEDVEVNVDNFDGNLSSSDDDLQTALETLDDGVSTVSIDTIDATHMADADHGEVSWTSGVASVEAMEGVDFGTMTDAKWCVYDQTGTEVDCNVEPVSDTNAVWERCWNAENTMALEPVADLATGAEDGVGALVKDTDTNLEMYAIAFDPTADEFRAIKFRIPPDIDTTSTATITISGYAATAEAEDVALIFAHYARADGENWDADVTEEALTGTLSATQDVITNITKTDETFANYGWAANDFVFAYVGRDGDHATDDAMATDFNMTEVCVRGSRA